MKKIARGPRVRGKGITMLVLGFDSPYEKKSSSCHLGDEISFKTTLWSFAAVQWKQRSNGFTAEVEEKRKGQCP